MPEIVTCPNCTRKLRVPENLVGKTVKCPECKEAFLAQTEAGSESGDEANETPQRKSGRTLGVSTGPRGANGDRAPLPDLRQRDDEDEDHPRRPPDSFDDDVEDRGSRGGLSVREGWKRVRLGLNLFIYGCYVFIGAYVIWFLAIILAIVLFIATGASAASGLFSANPRAGLGGAVGAAFAGIIVYIIGYAAFLLGFLIKIILQGIGQVLMLWIPNQRGTAQRPMAIAVLSLWGADLGFLLLAFMMYGVLIGTGARSGGEVFGFGFLCSFLSSFVLMIAWYFVFMIFLRIIAAGVRSSNAVSGSVIAHMIAVPVFVILAFFAYLGVVCVGGVAMAGFASNANSPGTAASAGVGWLIAIMAVALLIWLLEIALYIWYVVILNQVRSAISARLAR